MSCNPPGMKSKIESVSIMKSEIKTETEVSPRIRAITFCALLHGQTVQAWDSAPVIPCEGAEKRAISLEIGKAWKSALEAVKVKNGKTAITASVVLAQVNQDAQSLRNQSLQWLDSPDGASVLAALPDKLKRTLAKDLPSAVLARQAERAKHDEKEATAKKAAEDMAAAAAAAHMEFTGTVAGAALVAEIEKTSDLVAFATAAAAAAVAAFDTALADFVTNRPTAEQAARDAAHAAEIKALKERLAAFEQAQAPASAKTSRKRETVAA